MSTTSLLVLLPSRMSGSLGWAGVSIKLYPSSISVLFKSFGHFREVGLCSGLSLSFIYTKISVVLIFFRHDFKIPNI